MPGETAVTPSSEKLKASSLSGVTEAKHRGYDQNDPISRDRHHCNRPKHCSNSSQHEVDDRSADGDVDYGGERHDGDADNGWSDAEKAHREQRIHGNNAHRGDFAQGSRES